MRILRNGVIGVALLLAGIGAAAQPAGHVLASTHAAAKTVTVKIVGKNGNYRFSPASIKVSVGTSVVWKNVSDTEHTVTADTMAKGKPLFNKDIKPGKSASWTVKKAGTYKYHCSFHPSMKGKITAK